MIHFNFHHFRYSWLATACASALLMSSAAALMAQATAPPAANSPATPTTQPAQPTTVIPVPRDNERWHSMHQSILNEARKGGHELAFLGDSITQGWSGEGKEVWDKMFAPRHAINLGIGGDRTQHVLWRLENGLADALAQNDPSNNIRAIVLMIGTNNSNGGDNSSEEIAQGIHAIVRTLRQNLPQAKVLLLAIFPRGEGPNPQREKNAVASALASKISADDHVHYLDISEKFLAPDGALSKEIMPDLLHLSPKGYEIWANAVDAKVTELLQTQ